MSCSSDNYHYSLFYGEEMYCADGYSFYRNECCNHAAYIGWVCGLSIGSCLLLVMMVVCAAKRRQRRLAAFNRSNGEAMAQATGGPVI